MAKALDVRLLFIRPPWKRVIGLLLCNSHDEGIVHQTVLTQPGDVAVDSPLHMPPVCGSAHGSAGQGSLVVVRVYMIDGVLLSMQETVAGGASVHT